MERKRFIAITPEEREYLRKVFKCSGMTVWQAVTYRKNYDTHKRIRKAAIERGNPQMVEVPEFDSIFIENRKDADERMTQYVVQFFRNGAVIEGNLDTGKVTVRNRNGHVAHVYTNPTLTEIKAIQEVAMSL